MKSISSPSEMKKRINDRRLALDCAARFRALQRTRSNSLPHPHFPRMEWNPLPLRFSLPFFYSDCLIPFHSIPSVQEMVQLRRIVLDYSFSCLQHPCDIFLNFDSTILTTFKAWTKTGQPFIQPEFNSIHRLEVILMDWPDGPAEI